MFGYQKYGNKWAIVGPLGTLVRLYDTEAKAKREVTRLNNRITSS